MENSSEEFEPLFDYTRIQPALVICLDDDLDETPALGPKKRKVFDAAEEKKEFYVNAKDVNVIDCDGEEDDEEDWLPPPPKISDDSLRIGYSSRNLDQDATLKALRLKKQELASFAQSADEVVRAVEESIRKNLDASLQPSSESVPQQLVEPHHERDKLVIGIQDKDGLKHFRVYMDDKFERLFKLYAEKNALDVKNLVYCFDGDKINPSETPCSLGMEDNDIIEVHIKSS